MDAPTAIERVSTLPRRALALAAMAAILAAQISFTTSAFGDDDPWLRLTSAEPIVSGRHPTHFYHAAVAAESLRRGSCCSCYDPYHAAGYAHTEAVDFDARPFIPFLLGASREFAAARYKLGLAAIWASLPIWFWFAARIARCSSEGAMIAAALAVGLAAAGPGRTLFENGDMGQALGAVLAVVHMAFLVRCHSHPDCKSFAGLLLTAGIGWCLQPLIWGGVGLLSFGCWLGMFRRHSLRWHGAFGMAQAIAVVVALPWLADWVRHWWLTVPIQPDTISRPEMSRSVWPEWSAGLADRAIGFALVACGFVGGLLRRSGHRPRPMKWLVWSSIVVTLAAVASAWSDALAPFAAPGYLFLGLGLAVIPAAHGIFRLVRWVWHLRLRRLALGIGVIGIVNVVFAINHSLAKNPWSVSPLMIGLPPDLKASIQSISERTTTAGRILWEESCGSHTGNMVSLLPLLTERHFLSGAGDPENWHAVLNDGQLCGRSIAAWLDGELESFSRRYNVGWVIAFSPTTADRLNRWPGARLICDLGERKLFALQRPLTYVLKGSARSWEADRNRITLTDIVPEQSDVVLSLHYHESLRVRPGWVQIEREPDAHDPVPLIRLRMAAPAARVTLTWEPR